MKQGLLLNLPNYGGAIAPPPPLLVPPALQIIYQIKKNNPLCTGKQTGLQTNNIEKFPATEMSDVHYPPHTPKSSQWPQFWILSKENT